MIQIKKQDINLIDFEDIVKLQDKQLNLWAEANELNRFESWMLPQLVANFGNWQLVRDSSGAIDVLATLKVNCSDPKQQQFWKLTRIKRSLLVKRQIANPKYSSLTPLILMGFKLYQGVKYQEWQNLRDLIYILEPELFLALDLDFTNYCNLGSARLLEIRNQGLTQRSGTKVGQLKNPENTWSLTGIKDTELGPLPKLAQTMLTQIWLAHPKYRDNYMILDPLNWDNMPEPLITADVFTKQQPQINTAAAVKGTINETLPWMVT